MDDDDEDDVPDNLKLVIDAAFDSVVSNPAHIPLSLIPAALARLNLNPDDQDVLQVFHHAASGWSSSQSHNEQGVSRKDFRAVCAVLLDSEPSPSAPDGGGGFIIEDEGGGFIPTTDNLDDSDAYQESISSDDSDYADEYIHAGPSKPSKRPRIANDDPPHSKTLSSHQKQQSRLAFSLFFPDVADDKLHEQRIMIRDIIRVAGLLKEKIKAEEVCSR